MDKRSPSKTNSCPKCEVLGATADKLYADLQTAADLLAVGKELVDRLREAYIQLAAENAHLLQLLTGDEPPEA